MIPEDIYMWLSCHQAIEKILKAYYVKVIGETPPYIHGLMILSDKSGIKDKYSESQLQFIRELDPMNIEARYPIYKDQIFKHLTKEACLELILKTREIKEWINRKL
jgi:HEPN domain-containing protein